jgi:hypothetical protein
MLSGAGPREPLIIRGRPYRPAANLRSDA